MARSYGWLPARSSMIIYYPFDGNSNDISGNGRNGSDTSMTYGLSYGKFGQGASFNGSTGGINVPGAVSTGSTFTISFWFRPIASSDNYAAILANSASSRGLYYRGGSRKLSFYSGADNLNTTAFTEGLWYHVCVVVSSGSGTFYVNGRSDGTFSGTLNFTLDRIGNNSFSETFKGDMCQMLCESRAWSFSEVRRYYSQARGFFAQ